MGVRYDPGGGGPPARVNQSDTLIGADRPFFIGNDWFLQMCVDTLVAASNIAAEINIGATGLIWGDGSGLNLNNTNVHIFPALVDRAAQVARSTSSGLFSQMTLVSKPAAGISATIGPMVLANPGSAASYGLQMNSASAPTVLFRHNAAGGYTALVANVFNNAPGDVVRLESRIVGGFPELRSYQNGVLMNTTIDNSGLGPTSGQPGFEIYGVFSGQIVVSNVSVGCL